MAFRRKRSVGRVEPYIGTSDSDAKRGYQLVKLAQKFLEGFVEIDSDASTYELANWVTGAGGPEAVSTMLRLCSLEVDEGESKLTDQGLERLYMEAQIVVENLHSTTLNLMVVLSLFLTIFISLLVQHSGSSPYALPDESGKIATSSFGVPFLNGENGTNTAIVATQYSAWLDAGSGLFGGSSSSSQQSLRRGLYIAEFVINGIGALCCMCGLYETTAWLIAWGNGLPDQLTKLEFYAEKPDRNMNQWIFFNVALLLSPIGVACVYEEWKFAVACVGIALLGILTELIIWVRRNLARYAAVAKSDPSKTDLSFVYDCIEIFLFSTQIFFGYFLMLAVMTYSGPILLSVLLGLMIGHAFNQFVPLLAVIDKLSPRDGLSHRRMETRPSNPVGEGTTPCCPMQMDEVNVPRSGSYDEGILRRRTFSDDVKSKA
eukprot:g1211.t1